MKTLFTSSKEFFFLSLSLYIAGTSPDLQIFSQFVACLFHSLKRVFQRVLDFDKVQFIIFFNGSFVL